MVMYSTEGKYPVISMPRRVRRTNGLTYTAEAVLENLSDPTHPYIEVVDPPSYDKETHNLEWTGTDWLITEKPPAPIVVESTEATTEIESTAPAVVEPTEATTETEGS
jgi:hypothetical protein